MEACGEGDKKKKRGSQESVLKDKEQGLQYNVKDWGCGSGVEHLIECAKTNIQLPEFQWVNKQNLKRLELLKCAKEPNSFF